MGRMLRRVFINNITEIIEDLRQFCSLLTSLEVAVTAQYQ
jgi:hypothetical protein